MEIKYLQEVKEDKRGYYFYEGDVAEIIINDREKIVVSAKPKTGFICNRDLEIESRFKNTKEFLEQTVDSGLVEPNDKAMRRQSIAGASRYGHLEPIFKYNKDRQFMIVFSKARHWVAKYYVDGKLVENKLLHKKASEYIYIDDFIDQIKKNYEDFVKEYAEFVRMYEEFNLRK